jgi:ubiquinone/menaquinone biosynthesis C-methylase UbiE
MSREVAWEYLKPRIADGWNVVDVGAGESPFTGWLLEQKSCRVTAIDKDLNRLECGWRRLNKRFSIVKGDIRNVSLPRNSFDCAIAAYSLQCMIGYEIFVWIRIHEWLKRGGVFLCLARYQKSAPLYEGDRGDPLFGLNEYLIRALATLCLFEVVDIEIYKYLGTKFERAEEGSDGANAVGFQLRAIAG